MIRTVSGIFRKLGNKDARAFIEEYVDERAAHQPTIAGVVNALEQKTWKRRDENWKIREGYTMADCAVHTFNMMESNVGFVGGEPDMGQASR